MTEQLEPNGSTHEAEPFPVPGGVMENCCDAVDALEVDEARLVPEALEFDWVLKSDPSGVVDVVEGTAAPRPFQVTKS
jgi:hypothetical protein